MIIERYEDIILKSKYFGVFNIIYMLFVYDLLDLSLLFHKQGTFTGSPLFEFPGTVYAWTDNLAVLFVIT